LYVNDAGMHVAACVPNGFSHISIQKLASVYLCLWQVITFIHTLLDNPKLTGMRTCLVLCPLNTVLNWQAEFDLWLSDTSPLDVCAFDNIIK